MDTLYDRLQQVAEGMLLACQRLLLYSLVAALSLCYILQSSSFVYGRLVKSPHAIAMGVEAEIWKPQPKKASAKVPVTPYDHTIQEVAKYYRIDPLLIKAIIRHESNFDQNCVSHKGAIGLMQVMPATGRIFKVSKAQLSNPRTNIWVGTRFFKEQLIMHKNNLPLTLAAYNAGPAKVRRYKGIPNYPETVQYVQKILRTYRGYIPDSSAS